MTQPQVLWRKGRFWPGFSWRILAHKRTDRGRATESSYLQDHQIHVASEDFDHPVEFDELVIDHWFHLEQMSDRNWWIGLGNWHINVTIDGDGIPRISSYENESPAEYAEGVERMRANAPFDPSGALMPSPPTMPESEWRGERP